MPTPRPIIAAICGAKSGIAKPLETMPRKPMLTPRPKSAVPIGRPIASTEPKAIEQDDDGGEQAEELALGELEPGEDLAAVLDRHRPGALDLIAAAPGSCRPER